MLCFVFAVSLCVCLSVCAVCLGDVCMCARVCVQLLCLVSVCLRVGMFVLFFVVFLLEFCEVVAGVYSDENACISFSPLFSRWRGSDLMSWMMEQSGKQCQCECWKGKLRRWMHRNRERKTKNVDQNVFELRRLNSDGIFSRWSAILH